MIMPLQDEDSFLAMAENNTLLSYLIHEVNVSLHRNSKEVATEIFDLKEGIDGVFLLSNGIILCCKY